VSQGFLTIDPQTPAEYARTWTSATTRVRSCTSLRTQPIYADSISAITRIDHSTLIEPDQHFAPEAMRSDGKDPCQQACTQSTLNSVRFTGDPRKRSISQALLSDGPTAITSDDLAGYCSSRMCPATNNCSTYHMSRSQFLAEGVCVVTNCAARKATSGLPVALQVSASPTSLSALARAWVESTRRAEYKVAAGNLYLGRAFREGKMAAESARAGLFVVSTGFGLVSDATQIPNYDLTVSEGSGSLLPHLRACKESPSGWWRELNLVLDSPAPLADLVMSRTVERVLLAMPSTYLAMVADDLMSIRPGLSNRLQIFTSRVGRSVLPAHLKKWVLPYDERLEAVAGFAGTQADFPQRALRHFVQVVGGHLMPTEVTARAVDSCLGAPAAVRRAAGSRASDSDIQKLLLSHWDVSGGSSAKLLRYLRDEVRVACEQKRFQKIWHSAKAQRSA